VVLSAASPESGEAEEEVPVTASNVTEALEIGVNAGYVLDYLNGLGGGTVVMQVKDSQNALVFGGGDTQIYVVMPLRI
jgi:DNA polymerase III sliding clamp (beta) subunit (PCNA family)